MYFFFKGFTKKFLTAVFLYVSPISSVIKQSGKSWYGLVIRYLIKRNKGFIYLTCDKSDPGLKLKDDLCTPLYIGNKKEFYFFLNNIKAGIAIKPDTPWEKVKEYLKIVDQVIIMTVEPGFGGQSFMNNQLSKIEGISRYVKENNLKVNIEIDGGINYETGKLCTDAGANILVAGSFLFKQEGLIIATNKLNDFFN